MKLLWRRSIQVKRRQTGVALLLGTVLLLAILSITVASALRNTAASLADTVGYGASAAAMAAAESGIERSHGLLAQALMTDRYNKPLGTNTCSQLAASDLALGAGSFSVAPQPLVALAQNQAPCTDPMGCDLCTVRVLGEAGGVKKRLQADFLIKKMEGVSGIAQRTDRLYLDLPNTHSALITVLAARTKYGGGSNASVNGCDVGVPGSDALISFSCGTAWSWVQPGEGSTSGYGFFADASRMANLTAGRYSIQASFANQQSNLVARPYLMNGAVLHAVPGGQVTALGAGINRTSLGSAACGSGVSLDQLSRANTVIFGYSDISTTVRTDDHSFLVSPIMQLMGQPELVISRTVARPDVASSELFTVVMRYFHNPVVLSSTASTTLNVDGGSAMLDYDSIGRLVLPSGGFRPVMLRRVSDGWTGWVSYTLAGNQIQFTGVPDGAYQAGLAPMQSLHVNENFKLLSSGGQGTGGYACFSGVDPDRIAALRNIPLTRVGWSEIID